MSTGTICKKRKKDHLFSQHSTYQYIIRGGIIWLTWFQRYISIPSLFSKEKCAGWEGPLCVTSCPPAYVLRDNKHPPPLFQICYGVRSYMTPVLRKLFLTARPALSSLRFSAAPYISKRTMVRFISKINSFLQILSRWTYHIKIVK